MNNLGEIIQKTAQNKVEGIIQLIKELNFKAESIRISADALQLDSKYKEDLVDIRRLVHYSHRLKPDFQIYSFQLKTFSLATVRNITNKFANRDDKYLLIFSDQKYSQLVFTVITKIFAEGISKSQIRKLLVDTKHPKRTDLDLLLKLKFPPQDIPTRDLFQQISSAFDLKQVTRDFYKEYHDLFDELQKILISKNKHVFNKNNYEEPELEVRHYAQILLGRMMFLYFIQKKGWLAGDSQFLENLFKNLKDEDNFFKKLNILFYETLNTKRENDESEFGKISFLNGSLFEKDEKYQHELVFIPNNFFGKVIQFFTTYNFTIEENTPLDITVAIDPEMLGRVFENLLAEEERGKKGIFYTPREIVHYMCREGLKEYVISEAEEKINKFKIFDLFEKDDAKDLQQNERNLIIKLLKQVKIIDPAVGSGAFPVGMMHEIIRLRQILEPSLSRAPLSELKKEIIQDNLYGVDIEPEAVEIARLRLWLSLVVDEDKPEPLPNLDYKILQGNSLVDTIKGYDLLKLFESGQLEIRNGKKEMLPSKQIEIFSALEMLEQEKKKIQKEIIEKANKLSANELKALQLRLYQIELQYKKLKPKDNIKIIKQDEMFAVKVDVGEYHKLRRHFIYITDPIKKREAQKKLWDYEKKIFETAKGQIILNFRSEIDSIRAKFKNQTIPKNKQGRINELTEKILDIEEIFKRYENEKVKPFFLPQWEFKDIFEDTRTGGFNIVIANPPYVSTKGVSELDYRDQLEIKYGFVDDLYVHFTFRAFELCKDNHGVVCFITSDTFFTITTKQRMRELLQSRRLIKLIPTPKAFEATVNTAIFIVKDQQKDSYSFTFIDARELPFIKNDEEKLQFFETIQETRKYDEKRIVKFNKDEFNVWLNPRDPVWQYDVDINIYRKCIKRSFFTPSKLNIQIYNKYMSRTVALYEKWWEKIKDPNSREDHLSEINKYLNNLASFDLALFGLATEGGRGIDTGNNGRFLAIYSEHPEAEMVKQERQQFIKNAEDKNLTEFRNKDFIKLPPEEKIDLLREQYGDNRLGFKAKSSISGIYRVVSKNQIADLSSLSDDEKINGITGKSSWVLFEKMEGEEDTYYTFPKYYINWCKEYVAWLKKNSGKMTKYGMPTYRNERYQFRQGFVIGLTTSSDMLRSRISEESIFYGKTPKFLSAVSEKISDLMFVGLINSRFLEYFLFIFIDHTVSNQVNDIRLLPIIIPTKEYSQTIEELVSEAIKIQKQRFLAENKEKFWLRLQEIQTKIDKKAAEIYGIEMDFMGQK